MMKGLELIHLCRRVSAISLGRGIRTDSVLLTKVRKRGIPRRIPDEPGIRHRRVVLHDDEDPIEEVQHEGDLEDEVDFMNIENAYDVNESEKAKNKRKVDYLITAKKFFSPRPQPPMLTCNERQCIRYLHKEDPVQWNIKTLSESFPATPDTIKKIIKMKWKITPERAQVIDGIVQKNWERLANGELDADPNVLEHFKKFINRRHVLLEQLKNDEFYLPEVKKEVVWNKGEFSGLLRKYEMAVEKLVNETEMEGKPRMINDGMQKSDEKSSLDLVHEEIDSAASRRSVENKDSFLFGRMTEFYSKETTLEDLEDRILKRADENRKLDVVDRAILERKLGVKNVDNLTETEPPSPERIKENLKETLERNSRRFMGPDGNNESVRTRMRPEEEDMGEAEFRNMGRRRRMNRMRPEEEDTQEMEFGNMGRRSRLNRMRPEEEEDMEIQNRSETRRFNRLRPEEEEEMELNTEFSPPDERTLTAGETEIGKLLETIRNPPEPKEETPTPTQVEEKPKIDFSDPERLRRENMYYDNEVKDIENTAFWNRGRSSRDKALAEREKRPHAEPYGAQPVVNPPKTPYLSEEPYPEWIKIPKNKQRSGLTFKVKDCYYDDDGEFLYRVPGMTK